jgi:transcriptional regulator GlxA family with amidase domain
LAHRVAALCIDGLVPFDLAAVTQVFQSASTPDGTPLYEVTCCSEGGAEVATTTGFRITPQRDLDALTEADTVVVPGYLALYARPPAAVVDGLRATARRAARVISVCTGAFALAHAGLLDGRRATTHWAQAEQLAELFPQVEVDPAALYVDEGDVMTAAGLSAGIDLGLHIVRKDFGAAVGERAARRMVAAPHREGGQAQFIKRPPRGEAGSLEATQRWALERLSEPINVAALARHAGVSRRTLARRFHEEADTTPIRWLVAQRLLEVRRLLEETDLPIEEVTRRAGFGSTPALRQHFRRAMGTNPTSYRRSFRSG